MQFGLKPSRAKEFAARSLELSHNIKRENKVYMTTHSYDNYAKSFIGSTYTQIISAIDESLAGNQRPLDGIYEKASLLNDLPVVKAKELADFFIKQ